MPASNCRQSLLALPVATFIALVLALSTASTAGATTLTNANPNAVSTIVSAHKRDGNDTTRHERRKHRRHHQIQVAMRVAKRQVGDRYAYGGTGPNSFDCSGLIQFSHRKAGISLERTSSAQYYGKGRHISKKNMKMGDLIYFFGSSGIYHAGVYWGRNRDGDRRILHSSRSGTPVQVSKIWTGNFRATTLRRR